MNAEQKKFLRTLEQLRDKAPSIYSYFPEEKGPKTHKQIVSLLCDVEACETVSPHPGMNVKNVWEVLDFMIRRYKFSFSKKGSFGAYWSETFTAPTPPPVRYRAKPPSKKTQLEKVLEELF